MTTDSSPPPGGNRPSSLPSLAALGASMISVQVGASLPKSLSPAVGADGATALRATIAAVILTVLLRPWRKPMPHGAWPVLLAYGASLGVMNLMFYSSLRTIPLGVAVALEFTGPLAVAVLASRRWIDFLWIGLAVAGLLALLPLWRQTQSLDLVGIAFALGAGFCWALYIVFGQKAGAALGAQATAVGMIIATVIVLPIGVVHAGAALIAPKVLLSAFGVALLSSVLPYTCEMFALTRMPARVFGVLMSAEPAIAALMGLVLLHEALSPHQCVAIGAIMVASLGTTLTMGANEKPPTPV